jgi:hypothetical protein
VAVRCGPLAVAALALVAVTACDKPAPKVTVTTNGHVVDVEAFRYCRDKCQDGAAVAKTIRVRSDSFVTFDVPKRVADHGWNIDVGGQQLFDKPRTKSHYSMSIPAIRGDGDVPVIVTQGAGPQPEGEWRLQLLVRD